LPRQDHVQITIQQLVDFHTNESDEMLYQLDSSEYARLFGLNPTLLRDHWPQENKYRGGSYKFGECNFTLQMLCPNQTTTAT